MDVPADRALAYAEFGRRLGKAAVPGGGLERLDRVQRRSPKTKGHRGLPSASVSARRRRNVDTHVVAWIWRAATSVLSVTKIENPSRTISSARFQAYRQRFRRPGRFAARRP